MSLRRRVVLIAAAVAVAVAVLLLTTANVVVNLRARLDEQRRVLLPAVATADEYDSAIREQQRGERGFVITSDPRFLTNYEAGRAASLLSRKRLDRQLAGRPELRRRLRALNEARDRWEVEAAAPAVRAGRAGDTEEAARIVAAAGRDRFDEVQARRIELERDLSREFDRTSDKIDEAEDALVALLSGAAAATLLILVLVLAALQRWVIAPVERLSHAVRAVAAGDLGETVSVVGPREVTELAADVDGMRLRILSEVDEMRRANEALAQQAPLVVELRNVLLPAVEAPPAIDLASLFVPAEGVLAGDWFDVWTLDDGRVGIVVSDISGHGAEAGLFALRLKDLLGTASHNFAEPGLALEWVARRLGDTGERFATIFLAVVDVRNQSMRYASAGHPPVFLAQAATIVSLLPTGPLLGPLPGTWDTRSADLASGAILVAYTDGLVEARSPDGDEFGQIRLVDVVTRTRGRSPHQVVAECRGALDAFAAGPFLDDVTLLALTLASASRR